MREAQKLSVFFVTIWALGAPCCADPDRWLGTLTEDAGPSVSVPAADAPFGAVSLVDELAAEGADQQDPTLTSDELEIYFTTTVGAQIDIWSSTRKTAKDPWQPPARVAELSSPSSDANPEVSADGLTLYFISGRTGPSDSNLWQSVRARRGLPWGTPAQSASPPPGDQDTSPSLDSAGHYLAIASVRNSSDFDLYLSNRVNLDDPWSTPNALDALNSNAHDWDPALYFGATRIIFASRRNDEGDLFRASRTSTSEPFSAPEAVSELNTPSAEGDPWVSADGHRIYFASKKTGSVRIYFAER